jgi:uncharacterized membrane protein
MKEQRVRSIAKTATWRIIATVTTAILVYVFTGNFAIAISIGSVEVVSKVLLYYLHERTWDRSAWGKKS